MPMILVKKNPRGKVIRELSSEEETAVKTVCGLKKPATMALHNLANDILREMREYDAWLQCDCIPGDSPAMNFAALKNNTGTLYLSSFNHEHAPECWICPYISRHLLSLNPLLACCRRYSRGER